MQRFVVFVLVSSVCARDFYYDYDDLFRLHSKELRAMDDEANYNETFFPALPNYAVGAMQVTEDRYPWIGRVVSSRDFDFATFCTATCIEPGIFITSARSLGSIRVYYTKVIYQNQHLPALAFVLPSKPTKQSFDDIGFIVVNDKEYNGDWHTAHLFDSTNRTDEKFEWFANLNLPEETTEHVVVGYSMEKRNYRMRTGYTLFNLTMLEVFVNINICPKILCFKDLIVGFHVPCYHSCSVAQFENVPRDPTCMNYHGVEGGAIVNVNTNKVLGITTWAATHAMQELPVGFSVPNSISFFEDLSCARKIKANIVEDIDFNYRSLCEDINYKHK